MPCTKSAFFCQFEAFKGRIQWFWLHSKLQCSTAVKRTLPPWNLVDCSSQEIHFCGQKTGTKTATPSGRHRPRNQSSKKDYTGGTIFNRGTALYGLYFNRGTPRGSPSGHRLSYINRTSTSLAAAAAPLWLRPITPRRPSTTSKY